MPKAKEPTKWIWALVPRVWLEWNSDKNTMVLVIMFPSWWPRPKRGKK